MNEMLRNYLTNRGFSIWVEDIDPSHEDFAKLRNKGFGASDSSVLLNVNPFNNVQQLLHEKKHEIFDDSIGKKASVRKGKDLEDLLISLITDREPFKPTDMFGDDETGLSVNFDGVSIENGILIPDEIKVCTMFGRKYYDFSKSILEVDYERREKPQVIESFTPYNENMPLEQYIEEQAKRNGIPAYYYTQIQQQMYFLGSPYGYLNVMDDHNWCFHTFKIQYDGITIQNLLLAAKQKYIELQAFRGELPVVDEEF